jgi:hypothetical protein
MKTLTLSVFVIFFLIIGAAAILLFNQVRTVPESSPENQRKICGESGMDLFMVND